MNRIADTVYVSGMTGIIEGERSLLLIDPGFEAAIRPPADPKGGRAGGRGPQGEQGRPGGPGDELGPGAGSVAEISALAKKLGKPVGHIIVTHSHADHIAYLPDYIRIAEAEGTPFRLVAHAATPLDHDETLLVSRPARRTLDGVPIQFVPCGGHSQEQDELAVYLPEPGILFCGDQCQPQGASYLRCEGPTPVPLFYEGRRYIDSLEALDAIPFRILQLGHGYTLDEAAGHNAFAVTLQVVRRIEVLAHKLTAENPGQAPETVCEWIFDTIAFERGFDKGRGEWRKRHRFLGDRTEYQLFDRPGIASFVFEALDGDPAAARLTAVPLGARDGGPAAADLVREVHKVWEAGFLGPAGEGARRGGHPESRPGGSPGATRLVAPLRRALTAALLHELGAEEAFREAAGLAPDAGLKAALEAILQEERGHELALRDALRQRFGIEIL